MKIFLFEFLGIQVKSYGLMIAIGILVSVSLLLKKAKSKGYNEDSLLNLIILAIISGVLGGKLLFILTEFRSILDNPSILMNFGYGFVIYGAIILGALSIILYCRRKRWSVLDIMDLTVPGLAIAQGFGRIGCFLAGCCYGAETNLPIGVEFPVNSLAPSGVHLHPTQLYSSAFDFLLGFFLLYYSSKERKSGKILSVYLIIYSIGRFMIEFLRNDPRGNVGMLSTSQFIAIFTLVLGVYFFNFHKFFKGEKKSFE
ncbi:prolipoprotein diacylglyceryl transferase [Clostridium sp. CTA-5]